MNPYTSALLAYSKGEIDSCFTIERDDGFQQTVPASVFWNESDFCDLEERALQLCKGNILDVGAGAGRHSLELKKRGLNVSSMDISEDCTSIQKNRGLDSVITADVLVWSVMPFDVVLMLMNGIGIVGDLEGLHDFLHHARSLTTEEGIILCDSIDVWQTDDPIHIAYREANEENGFYGGQQRLIMSRDGLSEDFRWLHVDFETLSEASLETGWTPSLEYQKSNGHYLAVLKKEEDNQAVDTTP